MTSGVVVDTAARCGAKTRAGGACAKAPVIGNKRCRLHGGASPIAQEKRAHAILRRSLAELVTPIEENDPEADPVQGWLMEYRRTVGAIRYWAAEIANLSGSDELIFGVTKIEDINATEWAGRNTTQEARLHKSYENWFRERQHLEKLLKTWIAAGIEEKRVRLAGQYLDMMQSVMESFARSLGFDPHDPDIRAKATRAISAG